MIDLVDLSRKLVFIQPVMSAERKAADHIAAMEYELLQITLLAATRSEWGIGEALESIAIALGEARRLVEIAEQMEGREA